MRKTFLSWTAGLLAALGLLAGGLSLAQTTATYGWNPATSLEVMHGTMVSGSGGTLPVLSGCATVSASTVTSFAGKFTTSGTSCNLVITFPSAAPNGWSCFLNDLTTPSATLHETASTTTTATFAGTTVAADSLTWLCVGF